MRTEVFEDAVSTIKALGAERVLVLQGPQPLKLRAAYGMKEEVPWNEQVSLSILERSLASGECLLLGDARTSAGGDRWSVAVSEIRSVLCVPFWSPSSRIVGLLYADTLSRANVFTKKAMDTMLTVARNLERALYGGSQAPLPSAARVETAAPRPVKASGSLGLRPTAAVRRAPEVEVRRAPVRGRPQGRNVTVFYRSLATMITAGLPISRSLGILAQHGEDRPLQQAIAQLDEHVRSGSPLSAAMGSLPHAFGRLEIRLIQLAERTGALPLVLETLSAHREKAQALELQVKSALVYPAFILTFCLLLLILGPPYLLEGQFRLIREAHQEIPWLTRVLMLFSDVLSSPLGMAAVGAALSGAAVLLRMGWTRPRWRAFGYRRLLRVAGLGRALRNLATARFARSLAIGYRVGLPLPEALTLAAQSSGSPVLEASIPVAVERLTDGASLAQALDAVDFFPPLMVHSLKAAEEAGKVDGMMEWTARVYDLELESSLQTFLALIEPSLMLSMGILVAIVLLGTLLPMVNVLQSL